MGGRCKICIGRRERWEGGARFALVGENGGREVQDLHWWERTVGGRCKICIGRRERWEGGARFVVVGENVGREVQGLHW